MPIYQITENELKPLTATTFASVGIGERKDIQRLLRGQIGVLDDRLMVIAEEFGEWVDSSRRIDLLCIDGEANLVIVELKRTEDGGHMELQAIRYAAMVSAMTFDQLIDAHARYINKGLSDKDEARAAILGFLGWSDVDEDKFGQETRIFLASADFGKELTTAVMWLRDHSIDIRCVRLKPYRMADGILLLDVAQIIPLPEATEYQTQIGVKKQAERLGRSGRHDLRLRFWTALLDYAKTRTTLHANRKPGQDTWISGGIGKSGFNLSYVARKTDSQVELWISMGPGRATTNKAAFKLLEAQKEAVETDFGGPLEWLELPDTEACRIRSMIDGGYKSPQDEWPAIHSKLVDAMIRLDKAFRARVAALNLDALVDA